MTSAIEPDPIVDRVQSANLDAINACVRDIVAKLDLPEQEIEFFVKLASGKLEVVIQTKHFLEAQDLAVELGRGIQQVATDEMLELAVYKCKNAAAKPYLIKEMALAKASEPEAEASIPTASSGASPSGSTMYRYSQQTLEQDRELGREILRQTNGKARNLVIAKVLSAVIVMGLTVGISILAWRTFSFYQRVPLSSIDVNRLPDMGTIQHNEAFNVYQVVIPRGSRTIPSGLYIYMPTKTSKPKLPCVFIPSLGFSPLYGAILDSDMGILLVEEYLNAGYAVVIYDVDGAWRDRNIDNAMIAGNDATIAPLFAQPSEKMINQLTAYKESEAGVLNAKVAIDYAVARIEKIDPDSLYTAGMESSAGLALTVAASDSRIKGAIAISPNLNVTNKFTNTIDTIQKAVPGYRETIERNSPLNNAAKMNKPLFISFYEKSDPQTSKPDVDAFVEAVQKNNNNITILPRSNPAGSSNSYERYNQLGIKNQIEWLNTQTKK